MSTLQLFFGSVAEKVVFSFLVGFIFKKLTMKPATTPSKAKDFIFQEKNENKVVCVLDIQPEKLQNKKYIYLDMGKRIQNSKK